MVNRLKKFTGTVVVLFLCVATTLPWFYGRRLETHFLDSVYKMDTLTGVPTQNVEVNRGWLSSTLSFDIPIGAETSPHPLLAHFEFSASHGPLVKLPDSGWHTAAAAVQLERANMGAARLDLDIFGVVRHAQMDWKVTLPPMRVPGFDMSESELNIIAQRATSELLVDYTMPQFAMVDHNIPMLVHGLRFTARYPMAEENWKYLGGQSIEVSRISVNGTAMNVSDFQFKAEQKEQSNRKNMIETDIDLSFKELDFSLESTGPLKLNMKIQNLPFDGMEKLSYYHSYFQSIQGEELTEIPPGVYEAINLILNARPEITVEDFAYTLPEGRMSAVLNAAIGGSGMTLDNEELKDSLTLTAKLVLPRHLVYQLLKESEHKTLAAAVESQQLTLTPEQFDMEIEKATTATLYQMEYNEMLIREGEEHYRINTNVSKGDVSLNGKPYWTLPNVMPESQAQ